MRTVPAALAALTLTVGLAAPALAHPTSPVLPPLGVDLTHAATDNVAFVARFHEHHGNAGGALTSNDSHVDADGAPIEFYVVTDPRGIYTYDITDPLAPVLMDMLVLRQATAGIGEISQEDVSTDGRVALVDGNPTTQGGSKTMHIVSLLDPANLEIVGTYTGTDHTWTCVTDVATGNGCAYAYGRSNNIIDLRDPANPVQVAPGWKEAMGRSTSNSGRGYTHDLTEIRPGLVMSAGADPVLMDTTDPQRPTKLVEITMFDHASPNDALYPAQRNWSTFGYHSVEWPQAGTDAFIVMGTEIGSSTSDCTSDESVIETWDARPVVAALDAYDALIAGGADREAARVQVFGAAGDLVDFIRLDAYKASERGLFITGQAPTSEGYCAHWMEPDPSFNDGGRIAAGYYNRGARFVEVTPAGTMDAEGNDLSGIMSEIGWFTGADADTGSVQWVTDEIVYVHDYRRGLDILRITDGDAAGTYEGTGSVSEAAMTVAELEAFGLLPAPTPDGGTSPFGFVVAAAVLTAGAMTRRRVRA